ncbi:hypothetical protein BOTBODRAFT_178104 [Botryobasidium botryosum FD-172 SS1]|uniref:Uncharacterized protein n=1 Tax=Botryobasidium botryosum (strain FD-172 SS1) TaxID=930990 RepID=A0A067M6W5_BOTB1|nr:hypothetical protein BOTBODRAFT_178104 [Botryobasidium botryosum FD-172 SS1]
MSTSSANTVTVRECFRLYEQDGRRFELRFFNLSNYPVSPTHPDLIDPLAPRHPGSPPPFPLQPDGTYGNRDWLMCTYPYDRDCPWLHFIPTRSMWETPPVTGVNGVPFLIALDQHDENVWYRKEGDQGYIRSALRAALRDSWVVGVRHLKTLAATATQFKNTPMWEEQHFNWVVLDRVSSFRVAAKSFYDLQRWIAEIWGWAFMQEKLQGKIIHRRTLLSDTAIKLDRFTGVIMHWQRRDLEFEQMALRYGLPLYWLDDVTDPAARHAPWIGLPGRGQEATRLHAASGYWSMGKDKDNESANLYSLRVRDAEDVYQLMTSSAPAPPGAFLPVTSVPATGHVIPLRLSPNTPSLISPPGAPVTYVNAWAGPYPVAPHHAPASVASTSAVPASSTQPGESTLSGGVRLGPLRGPSGQKSLKKKRPGRNFTREERALRKAAKAGSGAGGPSPSALAAPITEAIGSPAPSSTDTDLSHTVPPSPVTPACQPLGTALPSDQASPAPDHEEAPGPSIADAPAASAAPPDMPPASVDVREGKSSTTPPPLDISGPSLQQQTLDYVMGGATPEHWLEYDEDLDDEFPETEDELEVYPDGS